MTKPPIVCVCLELNRAARALTSRYDAALAPHRLTSGQYSMLTALCHMGEASMGQLAAIIGLDRTTLTRNLAPLRKAGLIEPAPSTDGRLRVWRATPAGLARWEAARPAWDAAHRESLERLGGENWPVLAGFTRDLAA